eukprot:Gregarina_sp_Pseudo_9__176@NODE_1116_length_1865_cov_146_977547_g1043_i0_p1_GENE_NODE_1116_length_1865_cov_146_977547_g1043_i0NODE_1116_length_1865_cov_146_977547_g1043_i0_p1_ORF_typecomplete_len444_score59_10SLC35F/PF06027_12/93SLC35F/PF06027_12/1_3e28Nuc_sug_transp/PF04142_15/3_1e02Nuc_sug_transp/PF04142_15/4_1e26CRTlike/PF08627_10/3_8e02CRTlike/PF08627_10/4e24CRTlike/PF08627_10/3_2e02UAA/PF08449_11/1_7e17TPT/PF03151_16/7_2e14PUNUT/PF16913_5/1e11EamA/PF00892_20/2_1e02EamA/PF00892_20/4_4e06EamA
MPASDSGTSNPEIARSVSHRTGTFKSDAQDDTPLTAGAESNDPVMARKEVVDLEQEFQDLPLLHTFPSWTKWVAAFTCFFSGVISSYSFKIQNKQIVERCSDQSDPDCLPKGFVGAFLQAFLMFLGETMCLGLWALDRAMNSGKRRVPWSDFTVNHSSFVKPQGHWWGWLIPAALDTLATVCANVAMTLTYASTVQMLRNFLVVVCALMQLGLIRRALRIHEWVGVLLITVAMVLTAIPAIQNPEASDTNDGSKAWVGIVLAIIGTTMQGFQIIFEEWLFSKWRYSPTKAVGIEGIAGLVYVAIVMPISQKTGLEDIRASWYQFGHSWRIGIVTLFYFIACILFNASGLATTKLGGGLLRSIMFAVRAPAVWILDLIVGWIDFDVYNLVSIFVFLIGFAIHVRLYPASKVPKTHALLSTAIPCCCTHRELDEDYEPPADAGEV